MQKSVEGTLQGAAAFPKAARFITIHLKLSYLRCAVLFYKTPNEYSCDCKTHQDLCSAFNLSVHLHEFNELV